MGHPTAMNAATLAEPAAGPLENGPLDAEHHHALTVANARAKKIRKAAGVAGFNGWMTGFFAVASAPFALFSLDGFLVTLGLAVVAYNEFRGRKGLLQFDESAARRLGWNQLGFLSLIILYCTWMLFTGLSSDGPFSAELTANPELQQALGSLSGLDSLYRQIVLAVYGTMIVLTAIFQGWNAYYYFSRRKHVAAYVRETPAWVLDIQQATAAS
jgi:hypothetical protein